MFKYVGKFFLLLRDTINYSIVAVMAFCILFFGVGSMLVLYMQYGPDGIIKDVFLSFNYFMMDLLKYISTPSL